MVVTWSAEVEKETNASLALNSIIPMNKAYTYTYTHTYKHAHTHRPVKSHALRV